MGYAAAIGVDGVLEALPQADMLEGRVGGFLVERLTGNFYSSLSNLVCERQAHRREKPGNESHGASTLCQKVQC